MTGSVSVLMEQYVSGKDFTTSDLQSFNETN